MSTECNNMTLFWVTLSIAICSALFEISLYIRYRNALVWCELNTSSPSSSSENSTSKNDEAKCRVGCYEKICEWWDWFGKKYVLQCLFFEQFFEISQFLTKIPYMLVGTDAAGEKSIYLPEYCTAFGN